jgi:hypothetical protein
MMPRTSLLLVPLFLAATGGFARAQSAAVSTSLPPVEEQMKAAVLPLPAEMRAGAAILGYRTAGRLEELRPGTNGMVCLALYVTRPDFHVACYHRGLEAFMARGRELRAQGLGTPAVDSIRYREIADGTLKMPRYGALYSLTGRKDAWDPARGTASGASPLAVVYIPFATGEETGLSTVPKRTSEPWLMFPGTARAHIMLVGTMTP